MSHIAPSGTGTVSLSPPWRFDYEFHKTEKGDRAVSDWQWGTTVALLSLATGFASRVAGAESDVRLPEEAKAVWDLDKAHLVATPTRQRICINGLWRWQPASQRAETVPEDDWGFFKVPGAWPGIENYMQKDCQRVHVHPRWQDITLGRVNEAWYQREIVVPDDWVGHRIGVSAAYVNSYAVVYLDGQHAGEIRFPAGEVDLTSLCRPGEKQWLSLKVVALPLQGVLLSYSDTSSAKEVAGSVERRGLCGDMFLECLPAGPSLTDLKLDTSVRRWELSLDVGVRDLDPHENYTYRARVLDQDRQVAQFTSPTFSASDLRDGRIRVTHSWRPQKLWDTHTPRNVYQLELSLVEAGDKTKDTLAPIRFGFREFWIDGRDFYLNGSRIYLSSVPFDNAQVSAAAATYEAARESMKRLQSFGINFVYTHNYGCEPGSHLSFSDILRAADDVGMLVALSQPHFSHYDWESREADSTNGYARHARFYVQIAQNHPAVVMYSMSHNATGYNEDMNPDQMDGLVDQRDTWALRNAQKALRAEAIVKRLDPSRIVYHHASGNLGAMHTSNFYPNFAPIQELSDWLEHWATAGIKPVFLCEYGAPFSWDWTMYRGWHEGRREFGSAAVPWQFCLAEWNAQFLGDQAFQISEPERTNLRWEAQQFREGKVWHRWDYPYPVGSHAFTEREPIYSMYLSDNWRAFRTWGLSANSPWEHEMFWRLRDGVDQSRRDLATDWEQLQQPGYSPDFLGRQYQRMDLAFEQSDWIPTLGAQALLRDNMPLLAYLAGKPGAFTSKDHNFIAGETIEKQVIVINNSRQSVSCQLEWRLGLPEPQAGSATVAVDTGMQQRLPLSFSVPATTPPGTYSLVMTAAFGTEQTQHDTFDVHVLPRPRSAHPPARIAVFDPRGETAHLLESLGIHFQPVAAAANPDDFDVLIIGRNALAEGASIPAIHRVHDGLKVLVFEQSSEVLTKRLGFRVAEYGLRNVFPRVPDHPALKGLDATRLRDWRGEATLLSPRLQYELSPRYNGAPTVEWCGMEVTRVWRCGCRGNVASVLIEKPARGDFLPLIDSGFNLQYSPLLEYREGQGMVLFCQLDVTGRTEVENAAQIVVANLVDYVGAWQPTERRKVLYVGELAGQEFLESAGLRPEAYSGQPLPTDAILVVGPGGAESISQNASTIQQFLASKGRLLAIGLSSAEITAILPIQLTTRQTEHLSAYFAPPPSTSLLAGIGPSDVHVRAPSELPLIVNGANVVGDGVLATTRVRASSDHDNVVFCQLVPWRYDYRQNFGLKGTFRRTSYVITRLLANLGAASDSPLIDRFADSVGPENREPRWLNGFYLDAPQAWDDPYRFFRW